MQFCAVQLFELTGVSPERQKITVGAKQITDATDLASLGLKPKQVRARCEPIFLTCARPYWAYKHAFSRAAIHGLPGTRDNVHLCSISRVCAGSP